MAPVIVWARGLSPRSLAAAPPPSRHGEAAREGRGSSRSSARSCSEKDRSRFSGKAEPSSLRISPPSGDSSSSGPSGGEEENRGEVR